MGIREGERHYREYLNLRNQTDAQLGRSIKSYQKNIVEHNEKISNPARFYSSWDSMGEIEKQGRLEYWRNEVSDLEAKLNLAYDVLRERGAKMNKFALADYIEKLIERADAAHNDSKSGDDPKYIFQQGRALAYYEVLSSLQNTLRVHHPDELDDFGINFDMDKRFTTA